MISQALEDVNLHSVSLEPASPSAPSYLLQNGDSEDDAPILAKEEGVEMRVWCAALAGLGVLWCACTKYLRKKRGKKQIIKSKIHDTKTTHPQRRQTNVKPPPITNKPLCVRVEPPQATLPCGSLSEGPSAGSHADSTQRACTPCTRRQQTADTHTHTHTQGAT